MLTKSMAISDSITTNAVYEPWSHVQTPSRSKVIAEVCASVNRAAARRMAVQESQEQWYVVGGVRPSSEVSESRCGVRISNIVEQGRNEYIPVLALSFSAPGTRSMRASSG